MNICEPTCGFPVSYSAGYQYTSIMVLRLPDTEEIFGDHANIYLNVAGNQSHTTNDSVGLSSTSTKQLHK